MPQAKPIVCIFKKIKAKLVLKNSNKKTKSKCWSKKEMNRKVKAGHFATKYLQAIKQKHQMLFFCIFTVYVV